MESHYWFLVGGALMMVAEQIMGAKRKKKTAFKWAIFFRNNYIEIIGNVMINIFVGIALLSESGLKLLNPVTAIFGVNMIAGGLGLTAGIFMRLVVNSLKFIRDVIWEKIQSK